MTGQKKRKKAPKETTGKKGREKKNSEQKNAGKKRGEKKRKKKAREKSAGNGAGRKPTDYIVSDLSFTSDWVKKWCEISKPIKMRRGSKVISYNFGYFRRLIEHCFNCD